MSSFEPEIVRISNNSRFPKTYRENLEWRKEILSRAKKDLAYRAKVKELFHRDILFAFNAFFFTLSPKKRPQHHQPFATWDYEDELILGLKNTIEKGEDEIHEKTRDMGVTWCVLGVALHFWLDPKGGADCLLGSRKEEYVDSRGDPRTHFFRLRYMFYRLPFWLKPEGFSQRNHDNFRKLVNPETGVAITGESNNPNFSTQGRYLFIFFDEFAKWEGTDEMAWTAAGDASLSRIAVSTPFGAGGQYYRLITGGKTRKKTWHWIRHPEKALGAYCVWPPPNETEKTGLGDRWEPEVALRSPWFDKECERRTPSEVAQELEINYLGSGNPIFEGKAWRSLMYYHKIPDRTKRVLRVDFESRKLIELPEIPSDREGLVQVFQGFDVNCAYIISADVVEGVEDGDFAVVDVFNRMTKSVDATYFSRVDEFYLSFVLMLLSKLYTWEEDDFFAPWLAVETTGPGLATFNTLANMDVPNLFMATRFDVAKQEPSFKKGWRTDTNSRNELISGVRKYLVDRAGYIHPRLVGELMTFVRSKTGKPEAKSGCHDDEVMSFGIAVQVDELAPLEKPEPKQALRSDGLPEGFEKGLFTPEVKEPTIEERCFIQALMKSGQIDKERELWEERQELLDIVLNNSSDEEMFEVLEAW